MKLNRPIGIERLTVEIIIHCQPFLFWKYNIGIKFWIVAGLMI